MSVEKGPTFAEHFVCVVRSPELVNRSVRELKPNSRPALYCRRAVRSDLVQKDSFQFSKQLGQCHLHISQSLSFCLTLIHLTENDKM